MTYLLAGKMRGSITSLVLAALTATALAGPTRISKADAVVGPAELEAYNAPNAISMEKSKQMKIDQQARDERAGAFAENRYILQPATACKDGKAGEYSCNKLDLKGFLRHQDMQSRSRRGNDVWGKRRRARLSSRFVSCTRH